MTMAAKMAPLKAESLVCCSVASWALTKVATKAGPWAMKLAAPKAALRVQKSGMLPVCDLVDQRAPMLESQTVVPTGGLKEHCWGDSEAGCSVDYWGVKLAPKQVVLKVVKTGGSLVVRLAVPRAATKDEPRVCWKEFQTVVRRADELVCLMVVPWALPLAETKEPSLALKRDDTMAAK